MGAKLPVERICQPKPCLCTTHQTWGVCASTGVHDKSVILGVQPPYFGGELGFGHINVWCIRFGCWVSRKLMPDRFSRFWHNPKIWDCVSRTQKIGVTSIFSMINVLDWYAKSLDIYILVRPPNMGAKLQELDLP